MVSVLRAVTPPVDQLPFTYYSGNYYMLSIIITGDIYLTQNKCIKAHNIH